MNYYYVNYNQTLKKVPLAMEHVSGNNSGKKIWESFVKSQEAEEKESSHIVRFGYVNDGLYMKIIEKRSKRKFKKIEEFLLQEYKISNGRKVQILLSQDESSAFTLSAICQRKDRTEKLFACSNIITPRRFIEAFNHVASNLKLNNLLHHLPQIGKLDPEFATLLYDFITRTESKLYALECRMFFIPWNQGYIRICANWANPDAPIFGTIESNLFVKDVEGEPRNAMVQACAEAANKAGLNLKTSQVRNLILTCVDQAGEINF